MKLDLGCGKNKREGFIGVDRLKFDGVDAVADLTGTPWIFETNIFGEAATPWTVLNEGDANYRHCPFSLKDGVVDEVHCSHFIEHLTAPQRIHFVNELYRVLKPGAKAQIIVPSWTSSRAYGDLTHQWPPVVDFWFYYLSKDWRAINAPHNDAYTCHFNATWGYSIHPEISIRSQEHQQYALQWYKEAAQDMVATLVAVK